MNTLSIVALIVSGLAFAASLFYLLSSKKKTTSPTGVLKVPMAVTLYVPADKAKALSDGLKLLTKAGIDVGKIYVFTGQDTDNAPDDEKLSPSEDLH